MKGGDIVLPRIPKQLEGKLQFWENQVDLKPGVSLDDKTKKLFQEFKAELEKKDPDDEICR